MREGKERAVSDKFALDQMLRLSLLLRYFSSAGVADVGPVCVCVCVCYVKYVR